MSVPRHDYQQFLVWLGGQGAPDDVKRLARGVHTHFDEIAQHGHAQSARSRALVRLLSPTFDEIEPLLSALPPTQSGPVIPWSRLQRLEVGPFRGFTHNERLELGKRLVLVYGPNGTGKSSFCEALEYTLLGSVKEAVEKRIPADDFLANAYQGFSPPRLFATDRASSEIQVVPDADTLRFAFVERGRIEEFSRIGALTLGERARSIATLFGVEQFGRFVADFNEGLDIALDLKGKKAAELQARAEALGSDHALLETWPIQEAALDEQERNLAHEFDAAMSFLDLRAHLGTVESPGRLIELQSLLDQPIAPAFGFSRDGLARAREVLGKAGAQLEECRARLRLRQQDVSYRRLFEAVLELQPTAPGHCPACDTTLAGDVHVASNPYLKASQGLQDLEQLALWEQERDAAAASFAAASRALRGLLATVIEVGEAQGFISPERADTVSKLPEAPDLDSWQTLEDLAGDGIPFWITLGQVAEYCERFDQEIARLISNRETLVLERDRLQRFDRLIVAQATRRTTFVEQLSEARRRIAEFEAENKHLISEVEAEDPLVARNQRMKTAYDLFLPLLREFRDELPGTLMEGLNEIARDLYNAFNRGDRESDKLAGLRLPLTPNDTLEISFADAPDRWRPALYILSEGHLRCLGLAILLSKNIQVGCPVLVFDDVVNAIDDDHRNGICRTLFEDEWLRNKQIIVTCHGEEFIKSIQRDIGATATRDECLLYVFRPHDGDRRLNIDTRPRSKNYVVLAQDSVTRLEWREALTQSRRALEGLAERLWKWLESKNLGELPLIITGAGRRPELFNLVTALKKKLDTPTFSHERKQSLAAPLNSLLGLKSGSLEWSYLNSGVHESERGEFDQAVVRTIVGAVSELDRILCAN
jgi:hypothetical protein